MTIPLTALLAASACISPACSDEASAAPSPSSAVEVQHIALDLRVDWKARQAHGSATLTLSPRSRIDRVMLEAPTLTIEGVSLVDGLADGRALPFGHHGARADGRLAVTLDRAYAAHEELRLRVAYRTGWVHHSDPNNLWGSDGKGLRFLEPSSTDPRRRRQLWSGGALRSSRHWFPGIDSAQPLARGSELRVAVDAPLTAIGSGRLVSVQSNADGTRTFHWKAEAPHADSRISLVVGEYVDLRQAQGGVELHNFGYPDEAQAVADSVVLLPAMLRFFSELTGSRFPFPSYTQVFVQDLPWGHVGAGVATQTENMIDDHGTHADYLYLWDGLQAESLAQQWFGVHLSSCDPRHTWLDRGLAHHLAALHSEHSHGRDEYLLWHLLGDQRTTLADWAAGNHEALVPVALKDAAEFAAGNTPWARGAAVLHMLRRELGDDTWRRVLQHYVRENAGRVVCSDDLRRAAETVSGRSLGWFFEQWVQRAGQPVFVITRSWDVAERQLVLNVQQTQATGFYAGQVDIDIDGRSERVSLHAKADNRFVFSAPAEPALVHFDREGGWLKEMRFDKPPAELLHQLRHTRDTMGRQWAMTELVRLAKGPPAPAADPRLSARVEAGLREIALGGAQREPRQLYWRVRFNALQQLRTLLAPAAPEQPVLLEAATKQALLKVIQDEGSWLRATAISVLGLSRDPGLAGLYISHLKDPSDRVINAAAIALGRSGSPLAYDALLALPAHPSWKNQSLISALAGLKELRDPRGADLALRSLADLKSPRWTLATPIWDYRLAAAETLVALGRGSSAFPLIHGHFERSLVEGDINDIFSNLLLLATLGDARARQVFEPLKQRFAGDASALKAVTQYEGQLEEALKKSTAAVAAAAATQ